MTPPWWLWAVLTLVAAATQTARNAAQKSLTARLGTLGATGVRFYFGLPFAVLALATVFAFTGSSLPTPSLRFVGWIILGGGAQILATALMLAAMKSRSFVVATAYTKTEALQVAIFALIFLREGIGLWVIAAIPIATLGVMLMSVPKRAQVPASNPASNLASKQAADLAASSERPTAAPMWLSKLAGSASVLGIAAGAFFALSAVGFKGAIVALEADSVPVAASFSMVSGLLFQSVAMVLWQAWRTPAVLVAIARAWRASLGAGFLGALATQMWFLAFAIAPIAQVRTLGMVEILFAHALSRGLFAQTTTPRELAGIVLVVIGSLMLINA